MRKHIFLKGFSLYEESRVRMDVETENAIYLIVKGEKKTYDVRLMKDGTLNCTCARGSLQGVRYGAMCSHIIASILFITHSKAQEMKKRKAKKKKRGSRRQVCNE